MTKRYGWLFAALVTLLHDRAAHAAAGRAEEIFAVLGEAVVQIRVIDTASGDKSSIGSGFQVEESGLLATNFHVVSEYVHKPQRYRLEYLDRAGKSAPVELVDVDIVHDLALVRAAQPLPVTLPLASVELAQGERMYSMGNPLDLAMTIIEGTYNGYVSAARYRKILFSASLNPGMSGGPALNSAGAVVGVNVAHGGEQISFLVPSLFLRELIARKDDARWQALSIRERVSEALTRDQTTFFDALLARPWDTLAFGEFRVPGRISDTLKCWGGSSDNKDFRYDHVYQECDSSDVLFIEEGFETGNLEYGFHRYASKQLNAVQFYGLLATQFAHKQDYNANDKEQVGNFQCREHFVRGHGMDWRVSFCARRYRRFDQLYDVSMAMSSTELAGRGLVARLRINGIAEATAMKFLRRFVEAIEWKP
jgi:serine protease Do